MNIDFHTTARIWDTPPLIRSALCWKATMRARASNDRTDTPLCLQRRFKLRLISSFWQAFYADPTPIGRARSL